MNTHKLPISHEIETIIKKLNDMIAGSPINFNKTTKEPCKYGASCTRKNPTHFNSFQHPSDTSLNDNYLLQLKTRINEFKPDIIKLVTLFSIEWQKDNLLTDLRRPVFKKLLIGAKTYINERGNVRFIPEDKIYFYLLAVIHSNFSFFSTKYEPQFFINLFMAMEEESVTGIYNMSNIEYKKIFKNDSVNVETLVLNTPIQGITLESNEFISLANTTLIMSFIPFLTPSKRYGGKATTKKPRKMNKRMKTRRRRKRKCIAKK
jgi:hypothetical protein